MSKKRKIVVFDICDTLYSCNTTNKYMEFIYGSNKWLPHKFLSMRVLNKAINHMFGVDCIRKYNLYLLAGIDKAKLERLACDFVLSLNKNEIIFSLLEEYMVVEHYQVILVSATLDPIANAVCQLIGASDVYSSNLNYSSEGMCEGSIGSDLLGKKRGILCRIQEFSNHMVFVTDNKSDSSCIDVCDELIAVIPKGKGKNIAFWKQKGVKKIICL
jgi:phosphoserine phosphatase